MTSAANEPRIARLPEAMPISRILRLLMGLALLAWITPPLLAASWDGRARVAAVLAGLLVLYTGVHYVVARYLGWLHPWLGAAIAVVPVFVISMMGSVYFVAVIAFIGASLVLIAILGHPGCEVLALPSLIMRRRTHLACLLFSPLDWIEAKGTSALRGPR